MKLSVLDQSTASQGCDEAEAIRGTLALAKHCETLGYYRYWVSEHHNSDCIVGTAPEILMAAIAATTSQIRIGSAGVMLPHYATYKVAEQFRVLEALAPGRVDIGLGRAPGSDRLTAFALNPDAMNAAENFPRQVVELQCWLTGQALPEQHPFQALVAHPRGPGSPQMWMLGSSDYGAQLAAHLGMPYAFAYFFMDGRGVEQALRLYRENYQASEEFPKPKATICVWVLVADTEEEAWYRFKTREHWRVGFEKGVREPMVTPEFAEQQNYAPHELARLEQLREAAFVGTASQVKAQLTELADRLELDELVVVTWTYDAAHRHRSYELLAEAFELPRPNDSSVNTADSAVCA